LEIYDSHAGEAKVVATQRPRKNLFLTEEIVEEIKRFSYEQNISDSDVGRISFKLFFDLWYTPEMQKAYRLAEQNEVDVSVVIVQALRKVLKGE